MSCDVDRLELPKWYDHNLMTLLVVDPKSVYLYWEMCFEQWKILNGNQLLVNLYEVFSNDKESGNRLIECQELPPYTGDWYYHDLQPGRSYQAEICSVKNGLMLSVIKSNIVTLPPGDICRGTRKVEWCSVEGTGAIKVPTSEPSETMQELVDTMSFYMGIK